MQPDKQTTNNQKSWLLPTITLFFRFSAWIVFPLVAGSYLGQWLDQKYNKEPWLLLASVGAAFIISLAGLVREAFKEYKRLEKPGPNINKNNDRTSGNNPN